MQRAKKLLDRSLKVMDPYDTEMQQWCTAATSKLRRSATMPEWSTGEWLRLSFWWHFGVAQRHGSCVPCRPHGNRSVFSGQPGSSAMFEGHERSACCHQFVRIWNAKNSRTTWRRLGGILGWNVCGTRTDRLGRSKDEVARRRSFLQRDGQLLFRRMAKYVCQNPSFSFGSRRRSLDRLAVSLFWWSQSEQRCFGCVADLPACNGRRRCHWSALEGTSYSQSLGKKATHFVGTEDSGEKATVCVWHCRASALGSYANVEEIKVFSVLVTKVYDLFHGILCSDPECFGAACKEPFRPSYRWVSILTQCGKK